MVEKEKIEWLSSIGAKAFPESVKYVYGFNGLEGDFNLSERYLEETPLEELKAQYERNREFATKALEARISMAKNRDYFERS